MKTNEEIAMCVTEEWEWIEKSNSSDLPTLQDLIEAAINQQTTELKEELENINFHNKT